MWWCLLSSACVNDVFPEQDLWPAASDPIKADAYIVEVIWCVIFFKANTQRDIDLTWCFCLSLKPPIVWSCQQSEMSKQPFAIKQARRAEYSAAKSGKAFGKSSKVTRGATVKSKSKKVYQEYKILHKVPRRRRRAARHQNRQRRASCCSALTCLRRYGVYLMELATIFYLPHGVAQKVPFPGELKGSSSGLLGFLNVSTLVLLAKLLANNLRMSHSMNMDIQ